MDITSYLLGKKAGGGGGGGTSEPNIFIQTTKPQTKDGIWIESDLSYDNIVIDENINNIYEWDDREFPTLWTSGSFSNYWIFIYQNELYAVYWNTGVVYLYKYNKNTSAFTQVNVTYLTTISGTGTYGAKGEVVGNYFVSYDSHGTTQYLLKLNMNTFEAEVTQTEITTKASGTTEYYNNCAYVFGTQNPSSTSSYNKCYKLDYINNEVKQLPNLSNTQTNTANQWSSIRIGTKVYLFNFSNTSNNCYWTIFDLESETFSEYYSLPTALNNISLSNKADLFYFSNCIYLIYNGVWQLNLSTRTFTKLVGAPSGFINIKNSRTIEYGGDAILLGGIRTTSTYATVNSNELNKFKLSNKTYNNGDLIIKQDALGYSTFATELVDLGSTGKLLVPISNVFLYANDMLYYDLTTYVGDGTQWIKLKD